MELLKLSLSGMGVPPHWKHPRRWAARKGNVIEKNVHEQKVNYERGDPNLASNWSFLTGGRRPSCFPDFPDKHLPRLSMSPGGNSVRRSSPLGGQLCGAGLDLHDTF
jgi:hypothetical protein